jgi:hypothetical protein
MACKVESKLKVGFHEEHGRVWDGQQWSCGWKPAASATEPAIAIFPNKKEMVMPSILAGDLEGKGILKIKVDIANTRTKKEAKEVFWSAESPHFGVMRVIHKRDCDKQTFSALVNKVGQLTQISNKAVKGHVDFSDKLLAIVGERVISEDIMEKAKITSLRDKVKEDYQHEIDQFEWVVEPTSADAKAPETKTQVGESSGNQLGKPPAAAEAPANQPNNPAAAEARAKRPTQPAAAKVTTEAPAKPPPTEPAAAKVTTEAPATRPKQRAAAKDGASETKQAAAVQEAPCESGASSSAPKKQAQSATASASSSFTRPLPRIPRSFQISRKRRKTAAEEDHEASKAF